jgi:hypothetical protein
LAEIAPVYDELVTASAKTFEQVRCFQDGHEAWMQAAKFNAIGFDPYSSTRQLNLVEQINQHWSLVAALEAVRNLFKIHPTAEGFSIAAGASAVQPFDLMHLGDIEIVAEVFAATSPNSNQKLSKDLNKLSKSAFAHRYVMFVSPKFPSTFRQYGLEKFGIEVWSLALPQMTKPPPPAPPRSPH